MKNKYVKMDPVEHVLNRPGMYIGSVESEQINLWCHGEHDDSFVQKNITYIPGLYKIFDEIIFVKLFYSFLTNYSTSASNIFSRAFYHHYH